MSDDKRRDPVRHLRLMIAEAQMRRAPSVTMGFAEAVELERIITMAHERKGGG